MTRLPLLLLATAGLCAGALVRSPTSGDKFELLILHNNDMHARFEQTSQLSGACTTADREAGKCYGGFPRVAHVVKEARKAAQSGQGPPVLYLNAGDTYTGTAWFTIYKWKIAAEFINALQPDAVSLGNNEIEKGSSKILPFVNNINTKILASNVILKTEDNQNVQKSVIFDINGIKVGIIGYLTPEADVLESAGELEYNDEVIAVKQEVEKLKAVGVNIIIALGHSTLSKDMEIAKEVEGLDLVIAGQKNTFFWDGTTTEYAVENEPVIVTQESGKKVPVIRSSSYNKYLGQLTAKFDQEGEIIDYDASPILLDDSIAQDSEALQMVNSHQSELSARAEEVIGTTAVVLDGSSCKTEECNVGNLIADAIIYYFAINYDGGVVWTGAPLAVIPSGHIASSIAPANRPASITRGDLLQVLPQESNLVVATLSGTVLLQVLEHSVANFDINNPTGQLLQFSGIRAVYDLSREPGSRLVDAVARCGSCFVPEYYIIDGWRTYHVLMPAALAAGEYGYSMLQDVPTESLAYDELRSTEEFIKLRSPVYPEVAGRIVLNNIEDTVTDAPATPVPTAPVPTTIEPTTLEPTTPDDSGAAGHAASIFIIIALFTIAINLH